MINNLNPLFEGNLIKGVTGVVKTSAKGIGTVAGSIAPPPVINAARTVQTPAVRQAAWRSIPKVKPPPSSKPILAQPSIQSQLTPPMKMPMPQSSKRTPSGMYK